MGKHQENNIHYVFQVQFANMTDEGIELWETYTMPGTSARTMRVGQWVSEIFCKVYHKIYIKFIISDYINYIIIFINIIKTTIAGPSIKKIFTNLSEKTNKKHRKKASSK